MPRSARLGLSIPALALVLTLTGCRTYGAYESTEKQQVALNEAVAQFAQALPRMEGEAAALRTRAGTDSALARVVEDYDRLLADGRALLDAQQQRAATYGEVRGTSALREWVGASRYRPLYESYRATITEQQMISERYYALLQRAAGRADTTNYLHENVLSARYMTVPPFYYRAANASRVPSIAAALRTPGSLALPDATPAGPSTGSAPADTTGMATPPPAGTRGTTPEVRGPGEPQGVEQR